MPLSPRSPSLATAIVLLLAATPALAQDPDRRHVSVGAAAGVADPLHGDFDFTATSWQADVRVDTTRHFGFGVFYEEWFHADEEVLTDQILTGPGGPIGHVDRIATRTEHRTRVLGWSLLARGRAGHVTINGGGGIGYLGYSRDVRSVATGCTPPGFCRDSSSEFDNTSFAAQVQTGVHVDVAPHVALMGQFRLVMPVEDPGGGHTSVVGGVRVVF